VWKFQSGLEVTLNYGAKDNSLSVPFVIPSDDGRKVTHIVIETEEEEYIKAILLKSQDGRSRIGVSEVGFTPIVHGESTVVVPPIPAYAPHIATPSSTSFQENEDVEEEDEDDDEAEEDAVPQPQPQAIKLVVAASSTTPATPEMVTPTLSEQPTSKALPQQQSQVVPQQQPQQPQQQVSQIPQEMVEEKKANDKEVLPELKPQQAETVTIQPQQPQQPQVLPQQQPQQPQQPQLLAQPQQQPEPQQLPEQPPQLTEQKEVLTTHATPQQQQPPQPHPGAPAPVTAPQLSTLSTTTCRLPSRGVDVVINFQMGGKRTTLADSGDMEETFLHHLAKILKVDPCRLDRTQRSFYSYSTTLRRATKDEVSLLAQLRQDPSIFETASGVDVEDVDLIVEDNTAHKRRHAVARNGPHNNGEDCWYNPHHQSEGENGPAPTWPLPPLFDRQQPTDVAYNFFFYGMLKNL